MTLSFDAKENDDAYEYLQILFDNTSTCDNRSGASNGNPGTPNLSRYMAGFEMNTDSKDDSYRSYTFPVTSVGNDASATNPWGYGTKYPLHKQKFKSGFRATDGRLIVPTSFSTIVLRLNASGGSGSDEWAAKNVVAHIQAVDNAAPTKLGVSVDPGIHAKGDTVYVSVAFSEIVVVSGTPYLSTENNWGTLNYYVGSGTNVLTFRGAIPTNASGYLNITGLTGTVKDLAGNNLSGNVTASNLCPLDASYAWPITYDLGGGSASNPTSYTWERATFTLASPTRAGYTFAGWTGTGLAEPTTIVTIAQGSTGDRTYTATWTPIDYTITYNLAGGSAFNPISYTIESDDITLANPTRDGYSFAGWTGTDLDAATMTVTIAQGSTGNRSYIATWTPIDYTITYYLNGGSAFNPISYTIESDDITLANPTRDGYSFAGWTGTDLDAATMTVTIAQGSTGNRSYTATWTPIDYTITYNLAGGSASNPTSYTVETATFTLTIPTRDGYTFDGWTGTGLNEATQSVTISQGSTGNRTYTAIWFSSWGDAEHDGTTAERAYILSTTDDLNLLARMVNAGESYSGTFFKLGADITYNDTSDWNNISATENNYTAIGTSNHSFSGIFDGCGHTVSGIRIYSNNNSSNYRGLFGHLDGGTVKNLTVAITGKESCGGVVGYNNGTVENCHATATVAVYASGNGSDYHGGVVGNNVGLVDGCTSSATVNHNGYYWLEYYGGVVGRNAGTTRRCLSIGAAVNADGHRDPVVNNDGGTVASCHCLNCTVHGSHYNDLNAIAAAAATASPAGAATTFPYGGLQLYGTSLLCLNGTLYAHQDSTVSLILTYNGTDPLFRGFGATGGRPQGSSNPYSLTIPNYYSNVTLLPVFAQALPYSYGFEENDAWVYWNSLPGNNDRINYHNISHSGSYCLRLRGSTSNVVALPIFLNATSSLSLSLSGLAPRAMVIPNAEPSPSVTSPTQPTPPPSSPSGPTATATGHRASTAARWSTSKMPPTVHASPSATTPPSVIVFGMSTMSR